MDEDVACEDEYTLYADDDEGEIVYCYRAPHSTGDHEGQCDHGEIVNWS